MSFSSERKAFIVIGNSPIFMRDDDARTCHQWCMEDLNISGIAWDNLIRGYVMGADVVFFTGGDMYTPVTDLDPDIIENVLQALRVSPDEVNIFNGVRPRVGENVMWPRVFMFDFYNQEWFLAVDE